MSASDIHRDVTPEQWATYFPNEPFERITYCGIKIDAGTRLGSFSTCNACHKVIDMIYYPKFYKYSPK